MVNNKDFSYFIFHQHTKNSLVCSLPEEITGCYLLFPLQCPFSHCSSTSNPTLSILNLCFQIPSNNSFTYPTSSLFCCLIYSKSKYTNILNIHDAEDIEDNGGNICPIFTNVIFLCTFILFFF